MQSTSERMVPRNFPGEEDGGQKMNYCHNTAERETDTHPARYNQGIECWEYTTSHRMGFLEGNVIKYVTRYRLKDGVRDLKKARSYLDKLIKEQEREAREMADRKEAGSLPAL